MVKEIHANEVLLDRVRVLSLKEELGRLGEGDMVV